MIFAFSRACVLLMLFADMVERRFPDLFKAIILKSSFYCIQLYSHFQIEYAKLMKRNPSLLQLKNTIGDLVGLLFIKSAPLEDLYIKHGAIYHTMIEGYDFKVCHIPTENYVNMKLVYPANDNNNNNNQTTCEETLFRFFLLEFCIDNTKYKINLKTEQFNYFLVDNRLTKQFFMFYLQHHLHIHLKPETLDQSAKCCVKLVDHNVDTIDIDFTEKNKSILLLKNSYTVETS